MEDLEKQIEKAAKKQYKSGYYGTSIARKSFIKGTKSEAAKKYWQQEMYSKKEVEILCNTAYYKGASDEINLGEFHTATQHIESFKIWFEENKKK